MVPTIPPVARQVEFTILYYVLPRARASIAARGAGLSGVSACMPCALRYEVRMLMAQCEARARPGGGHRTGAGIDLQVDRLDPDPH
jgi:hypothetical protein